MGTALAIDLGTKRTGFAASDPLRIATRPLEVWHGPGSSAELIDHIEKLVEEWGISDIIVGLPLHMDGGAGQRAEETRAFIQRLQKRLPALRTHEQDERLSTKAAEDLLREAGHHGDERKARRDSWSALVILRDWIEGH